MATEPLSWLPLSKGVRALQVISYRGLADRQASHVVLIGDHKQLPPVISSPAAHLGGLSTSMFERLIRENGGYHSVLPAWPSFVS
jgi:superfamily I DNA and/or RNA helicase